MQSKKKINTKRHSGITIVSRTKVTTSHWGKEEENGIQKRMANIFFVILNLWLLRYQIASIRNKWRCMVRSIWFCFVHFLRVFDERDVSVAAVRLITNFGVVHLNAKKSNEMKKWRDIHKIAMRNVSTYKSVSIGGASAIGTSCVFVLSTNETKIYYSTSASLHFQRFHFQCAKNISVFFYWLFQFGI